MARGTSALPLLMCLASLRLTAAGPFDRQLSLDNCLQQRSELDLHGLQVGRVAELSPKQLRAAVTKVASTHHQLMGITSQPPLNPPPTIHSTPTALAHSFIG